MAGLKKPTTLSQSSYNSLYVNPLTESKHRKSCSEADLTSAFTDNKENNPMVGNCKENAIPANTNLLSSNGSDQVMPKKFSNMKSLSTGRVLKPPSLQLCMQMNKPEKAFKSILWDFQSENSASSLKIWDYSDSEAAPASSWSTLPNRPLPLDIERCIIVKEKSPEGLSGGTIYSLYTNEGQGRQDRKLAIGHHKRRNGKSVTVFSIAQNVKGVVCSSDNSFVGSITANFMGTKYHVWNQVGLVNSSSKQRNSLLAVVIFVPTVTTFTGNYRSMRVFVPKHQLQIKNIAQMQHINGLPMDWEARMDKVHKVIFKNSTLQ